MTSASLPFSLFIKAESAKCNLDCYYCYYLQREGKQHSSMSEQTLELIIKNHIQSQPEKSEQVDFIWHGGEPMLRGLEFYQKAVKLQQKHRENRRILNTIQTNGTLINQRWASFFKQHQFMVGISIDGPNLLNDIARIDKQGNSSFERTMRGLQHLRDQQVEFNTLTVINNKTYRHGKAIYQFLKEHGSGYMQFQPCIDHELDRRSGYDWSLTGQQWGQFLCETFDEWCKEDIGKIYVQFFENCLMVLIGYPSQMCHHSPTCGQQLMAESNGDIYSCDHFGFDNYKLGNANNSRLNKLVSSPQQLKFGQDKWDALSQKCQSCDFLQLCYGGCPKNRLASTSDGEPVNVLCQGYDIFFRYALPRLLKMTDAMRQGHSPAHYQLL
ncbi:anaerobic sulfatase maturase [Photobacterium sp. SDRW27]|uniref:anaerobic sulfatase maturase n=1 Tax=Photobacterium obscurum TaxID=2829490 RepID=UPI0022448C34|nr:anaerobic sulfatase maturase [Photobacterium obscurum]MCW8327452.1 anaerobic sulfatase maturase [Photobacterium obscurum]